MGETTFLLLLAIFVIGSFQQEDESFCKDIRHYNSPTITCCAFKAYPPSKINLFSDKEAMSKCLNDEKIQGCNKLIEKTWLLYGCLAKQLMDKDVNFDTFTEFMIARFDSRIQEKIRNKVKNIKLLIEKKKLAETITAKPNSRRKREEEDSPDASSESPFDTQDTAQSPIEENSSTENNPEEDPLIKEDDSMDEENPPSSDNPAVDNGDVTDETPAEDGEEPSIPANGGGGAGGGGDSRYEYNPWAKMTPKPIPVFQYISTFEYYDSFNTLIPDENIFEIWDAYFVAEFETCQRLSNVSEAEIKSFGAERCYNWMQQTGRAGDCCGPAPIPVPLIYEPTIEIVVVQNYTSDNIFKIPGTYTYTNLSYSSNMERCHRYAVSLLQNQTTLEELTQGIEKYISSNFTAGPNYKEIVSKLIPEYYPQTMKDAIIKAIVTAKTVDDDNPDQNEPIEYESDIDSDAAGDIDKIKDPETPTYEWVVVSEWQNEKIDVDKTRYLMWTCDAYRMIFQRIKYFDPTPFCY